MSEYKEVNPFTGKEIDEDAPANVTGPSVAGTGDDNTVHTMRKKKKKTLFDGRTKVARKFIERILKPLQIDDYKLWKDEMGNVMTYCCVDMSARDYSKIGLLFSRNGVWNDEQLISKKFIDETFRVVWETPSRFTDYKRYYSLHWWVSKYDEESKIFNTSGKFGQYTFIDRENDIVVTRISKYSQQDSGDTQKWGLMKYFRWVGIENAIAVGRKLIEYGSIKPGSDVITPFTEEEGESNEFYIKYPEIIDAIADLSRS